MALSAVALASAWVASAAALAVANSIKVVSPSAKRSPTSTAWRLRSSVRNGQIFRQQAHPNTRNLRSLTLPRRNFSIGCGSVQARHSSSVIASLLAQEQVHQPAPPHMLTRPQAEH